ncbi:hypothetical protein ACVR1G_00315 [Streptococcus dentasini]
MVFNNDRLLNQIRNTANMIDKAFHLEPSFIDLGTTEDEEGHQIKGNAYLDDLVNAEKFEDAAQFIHRQVKTLNNYHYNLLVDRFIHYLQDLDQATKEKNILDDSHIAAMRAELKDFKW